MVGWIKNEKIDGWMDKKIDGWLDGWIEKIYLKNGWLDG